VRDPSTPTEVAIICNGNRGFFNVDTQLMVGHSLYYAFKAACLFAGIYPCTVYVPTDV
jgi:hypothetical protein